MRRELGALLVEQPAGGHLAVEAAADFCSTLELFLPRLLATRHPEWTSESLDGFFIARAVVLEAAGLELVGTCILIRDQAVTPFRLELALSPPPAALLESVRVRLGEPGRGALGISGPAVHSSAASKLLLTLVARLDSVRWSYDLQFRRP